MSITSFTKPSDSDVLPYLNENAKLIEFIGKGCMRQSANESLDIRKVRVQLGSDQILKNVIFVKKGVTWFFKSIETAEIVNDPCYYKGA